MLTFNEARTCLQKFRSEAPHLEENLVVRPSSKDKVERKEAKKALKVFLDHLFSSKEVKQVDQIHPSNDCLFYLKNRNKTFDKYRFSILQNAFFILKIIKNDVEVIHLDHEDRGVITYENIGNILNGNRIEWVHPKEIGYNKPHSTAFWDNWEQELLNKKHYQRIVHPAICKAVNKILVDRFLNSNKESIIVDFAGGKGHLAERLLEDPIFPINYILLDNNEKSIECAKKCLKDKAHVVLNDIVKEPFFQDSAKRQEIAKDSVDIMIGSGVLNYNVLTQDEAFAVLKKIHHYLKPGGYLILSGLTASLVEAEDLIAAGFKIINMSLPKHPETQFYIAQKI